MRRCIVVLLASAWGGLAAGQHAPVYRAGRGDVGSVGAAAGLALLPTALDLPHGPPSCAPCDPAALPAIDRGAVGPVSSGLALASHVTLAGVVGFTTVASLHGLRAAQRRGNLAVLANATLWATATTSWLKVTVGRERPVLYTSDAPAAASDPDNQRSWPSGHAAVAFSAATAYLVMSGRQHLPHRTRNAVLLQAFTEEAHRTGLEYFKAWYATDPDRQLRTVDQLVAEWGTVREPVAA